MRRAHLSKTLLAACLQIGIASLPAHAAETFAVPAGTVPGETIAGEELAELSGGTNTPQLGIAIDDLQLIQSTTVTSMTGNLLNDFTTGAAFNNVMSDVGGVGNTMVVNTGVLTMSNSVNLNLILNMSN